MWYFTDDLTFNEDEIDYEMPIEFRQKRRMPRITPQELDALPLDENPSLYIQPQNADDGGYYARVSS